MTWTYDLALTANKDKVRFLMGDVLSPSDPNASGATLQDEEINFLLGREPSIDMAACKGAFNLAGRYAMFPADRKIGDLGISYGEIYTRLLAFAKEIRGQLGMLHMIPTAGGINQSDEDSARDDTSLMPAFFRRNMQKFPLVPVSASQISSNEGED